VVTISLHASCIGNAASGFTMGVFTEPRITIFYREFAFHDFMILSPILEK
jgi:hypothetical protein